MIIDNRKKNAEIIPCKEFRGECCMCASGFIAIGSACSGRDPENGPLPYCLRDELPKHLCQPNGLPLGWGKFTTDNISEPKQ